MLFKQIQRKLLKVETQIVVTITPLEKMSCKMEKQMDEQKDCVAVEISRLEKMQLTMKERNLRDLIMVGQVKNGIGEEDAFECSLDMSDKITELFCLIQNQSWSCAIERLRLYPSESYIWAEKFDCDGEFYYRRLPIHEACLHNPPSELIDMLLKEHPNGAKYKDNKGRLPIHYACSHGTSPSIVATFLLAYPESISIEDNDGKTPLQGLLDAHVRKPDPKKNTTKSPMYYLLHSQGEIFLKELQQAKENSEKKQAILSAEVEKQKEKIVEERKTWEDSMRKLLQTEYDEELLSKTKHHKDELEARDEQNNSLRGELKIAQEDSMALLVNICELKQILDCKTQEAIANKQIIATLEEKVQDLQKAKKDDNPTAIEETETLKNQIGKLESLVREKDNSIYKLIIHAEERFNTNRELETTIAKNETLANKKIQNLETEITELKNSTLALQKELRKERENHCKELNGLKDSVKEKENELVEMRAKSEKDRDKAGDIRNRALGEARLMRSMISDLKQELSDMTSTCNEQKAINEKNTGTLSAKEKELSDRNQKLTEACALSVTLQKKLDDINAQSLTEKEQNKQKIDEMVQKFKDLESKHTEQTGEFIQVGKRLNEKNLSLTQELKEQIALANKYKDEKEQQQIELDMVSSFLEKILDQQLHLLHSTEKGSMASQETKQKLSSLYDEDRI